MPNRLREFMPTMGTGPRSSDPLNYDEAREAMDAILEGDYEPATFGAFMVAERWKGQEPTELAGFLDEIRARDSQYIQPDEPDLLDVAGRFDGKHETPNTDFVSSIVASSLGVPIITHSGRDIPTQKDVTFLDVVDELGWNPEPSMESVKEAVESIGFAYANQSVYAPALDELRDHRADLGVRCFLNTIESMVNPANAKKHMGSFYHLSFAKRVCDTFEEMDSLSPDRVTMIQGIEGQTEFRPGVSVVGVLDHHEFEDHEIPTGELGLDFDREALSEPGADAQRSAQLLVDFLSGEDVPSSYKTSVLLNTALKLWAGDATEDLEKGRTMAQDAIQSGDALEFYHEIEAHFRHE
jgi:anthranilate phosphoribosyltransferase